MNYTPRTDAAQVAGSIKSQSDTDWPWAAINRGYDFARELERENARLRDALHKIVNDLQGLAYAEHGIVGMAADYAPSLPDALSLLANSASRQRAEN